MADLATKAFNANDFGLAADIYERTIVENGPTVELYLGLANSYARGGPLCKAFEAYSSAFSLGKVEPEQLSELVTGLVTIEKEEMGLESQAKRDKKDIFSCFICKAIWTEPLTLPCGDTFCKKCLEKVQSNACKQCGLSTLFKYSSFSQNVILAQTVLKWFPGELEAVRLKSEGNECFAKREFSEAIKFYSKAIEYGKSSAVIIM